MACGNIGKPYSEIVAEGSRLDVVTLEVSSFQLERIVSFRPAVSVWLNFTPDHLDRYADEEEYRAAKLRIFENQTAEDWAIFNARDILPPLAARPHHLQRVRRQRRSASARRRHPLSCRAASRAAQTFNSAACTMPRT